MEGLTGTPGRGRTVPCQKHRNLWPRSQKCGEPPPNTPPRPMEETKTPSPGAGALHPEPGLRGGSKGLGFGDQLNLSFQPVSLWPCRAGCGPASSLLVLMLRSPLQSLPLSLRVMPPSSTDSNGPGQRHHLPGEKSSVAPARTPLPALKTSRPRSQH